MTPPTILPYVALQHDFANVIADVRDGTFVSEDIYLSGYKSGSPCIHGKVNVYKDDDSREPQLESRDGVELKLSGTHGFTASIPGLGIADATLRVPRQTINFNPDSVSRISAFDISPDGSLVAAGHLDGDVSIQSSSSASVPVKRKRLHVSTVLSIRFFPSSRVLLSASSDMSLNIISADPSPEAGFPLLSVARTLKGHKAAVTDTHIVGAGKTVYSCGKDGSIRLWDVAQATKAGSTLTSEGFNPIMRMSVANAANANTEPPTTAPSSEGHIIYAALQNGTFNVFDTRVSTLVYASPLVRRAPALLSIAHDPSSHLVATGNTTGLVEIYDIRQLPSPSSSSSSLGFNPIYSFKRSDSSIDDLLFVDSSPSKNTSPSPSSLLVATGDGFPFRVSVPYQPTSSSVNDGGEGLRVVEEYAAHADEGVRVIRKRRRQDTANEHLAEFDIWTAGDDGLARRY